LANTALPRFDERTNTGQLGDARKIKAVALRPLKSNSPLVARAATVWAQITYALEVALEWIALVLLVLIAIGAMLLASVLYPIIWIVRQLLEGP
jgi:hypothetical protein